jgi:hypothetical protein
MAVGLVENHIHSFKKKSTTVLFKDPGRTAQ